MAGDVPAHTHVATDIVSGSLPFTIQNNGSAVGTRRALNLIQGTNTTLTITDDPGNDRVTVTIAAAGGANHNLLSATHPDTAVASPVLGDLIAANASPAWARLAGQTTTTRKFLRQVGTGSASALPSWDTLVAGDLPTHNHAAGDINSGTLALARGGAAADLSASGPGFLKQASAGAAVTVVALASGDLPTHTHTSSQISDATANATASTVVQRDGSAGANFGYVAANNVWAYLDSHLQSVECGAYQTVGGTFENMAKYSEDFSVGTWDKNGGSCSVSADSTTAPDGNATADMVTASTSTPVIQQQIAGLVDGGQYTFYVWAKVASGTKLVSLAIVNNAYGAYLAGPTQVTLTTSWQRFKVTGTLAGGQTGLWIVVRQYDANADNWTSGAIYLWGACLQEGNDPKKAYARTWAFQTSPGAAGVACGPLVVCATNSTDSPFKVRGPGSNLADHTLLEVTGGGELIIAGSTGNGYRLAELMGATNPSGWSGVLKVKNPAGATAGYILLYSNP